MVPDDFMNSPSMRLRDMDICKDCINKKIEDISCCECKIGIMSGKWISPSIIYTCNNCGANIVGDGFWYPCQTDSKEYQVVITESRLSKEQLVFIAKYINTPVLLLKDKLSESNMIDTLFNLDNVMKFAAQLKEKKIQYEITPQIIYNDYWNCRRRWPGKCEGNNESNMYISL